MKMGRIRYKRFVTFIKSNKIKQISSDGFEFFVSTKSIIVSLLNYSTTIDYFQSG